MYFFLFVLILVLVFIIAVGFVMLIRRCSVREATASCVKFVKEIFDTLFAPEPPPKYYYPIIAGYDGYRILPQMVENEFSAVCDDFLSCVCVNFSVHDDVVVYCFEILRKPHFLTDAELETMIQKQSEAVAIKTMRRYDTYLPAEPLTYIELFPTKLYVAFARTKEGIRLLDGRKMQRQHRKVKAAYRCH